MTHGWVMEVLSDLRNFARDHRLAELEARLAEASVVAALELSNLELRPLEQENPGPPGH